MSSQLQIKKTLLKTYYAILVSILLVCCCESFSSQNTCMKTIVNPALSVLRSSYARVRAPSNCFGIKLSANTILEMKRNFHMMMSTTSSINERHKPLVIIISGPTAVGKSAVAAKICSEEWSTKIMREHAKNNHGNEMASKSKGHIISADSVQAYQGVQIGANKPTASERAETPHHLIDIVDSKSVCQYNAADYMRDAMYVLENLTRTDEESDDEIPQDEETTLRKSRIDKFLEENKHQDGQEILPVIVGGTMMYLQWIVHGRPDAMKPSPQALEKAAAVVLKYQNLGDDDETGWAAAVEHVSSLGPLFAKRVAKLPRKDWYRLRRTLEVAYTVLDDKREEEKIKQLYNGQRQGGLDESPFYDVRCFFLCPDDRMAHTAIVDSRCEDMIAGGLLKETSDLYLSGQLPEQGQQSRAIGYRQTLDYLNRENFTPKDGKQFDSYLHEFTTATRRYAKKQMQWFRKDSKFIFVPVPLAEASDSRVDGVAQIIRDMCIQSREDFEKELLPADVGKCLKEAKARDGTDENINLPLSARTKMKNEQQAKKMKFYQPKRHRLLDGSQQLASAIDMADKCIDEIKSSQQSPAANL